MIRLILLLCIVLSLKPEGIGQKEITLEDIWSKGTFGAKSLPGFRFLSDGQHYTRLDKQIIKKYTIVSGSHTGDIFDAQTWKDKHGFGGRISDYTFSQDENMVLILSESEGVYRHSTKNTVHLYDVQKETLTPVFPEGKISNPEISPDGTRIAFVFQNNLYVSDIATGKRTQITKDGLKNSIINGMCDWVYEEEFSFTKAFQWSADGKRIAFIRFDETDVPEFSMEWYRDGMYPERETFKYPKVGEKNAVVSVFVYDVEKKKKSEVALGNMTDMYIPRIKWTADASKLCIQRLNRFQNHLEWLIYDADAKNVRVLLEEKNKYYIDINDDLTFLSDKKHFIISSEKEGYHQLFLHDMDGQMKVRLTPGDYDVTAFYGVDERLGKVYFQAAMTSPMQKQVYVTDLEGKSLQKLVTVSGTCSAQFSATFEYYVLTASTANTPPVYAVYNSQNELVRFIEENSSLRKIQEEYQVRPVEFFQFTTSEEVPLNGWMIKPPGFDPEKKYPVFMTQYSGPGSQSVTDSWGGSNYWWHQLLAQKGYIVVCVDGRGTGGRGETFKKMTYLRLGHYETIDQIEAARYLGTLSYIDASRIGIYGWSYGGFMSSLCILKGNDIFKAAIAVAPVISWKWYDTIYTERYMRTLKENEAGYRENSPFYFADRLKGNYLLIHGMADDNVHFQHAVEMANALINANKQFDTYYYPNRNHGIYGGPARLHLYTKMTDFILQKI